MGIDEVIVYCINDGAVMDAWADDQKVGRDGQGTMINFLADTHGKLTDALGLRMSHEGPLSVLGSHRSKRFSAYFDRGVMKVLNVAENPLTDPAGDDHPEHSFAEQMIKDINNLASKEL
jgi:peroxiredoxin